MSNEIYLAPAAEILNEENLALKVKEEYESNKVDGAFEIKEVNAENSMNLEALPDQKEVDSRSNGRYKQQIFIS